MNAAARLPFTVIGGFLGAGKTTLLNRWLREAGAAGQRLAVLVNDFGALNIDAALVAEHSGDTVALTNGCVCCQIGDDLSMALIRVLEQPGRFDAVVVEASGVSDPWRIAQLGRADPGLVLDGVVVLVDAAAVQAQSRDRLLADTLERQLLRADLVVLNKADLAGADAVAEARAWVARVAPAAAQCEATQADVPLSLLSGRALLAASDGAYLAHVCGPGCAHAQGVVHAAHGEVFETWSCRPEAVFSAARLRDWLKAVPAGVLRAKGLLRTDEHGWSEVQFAGQHGVLRRAEAPVSGAAFVVIGLRGRLPVGELEAVFGGFGEEQGARR